MELLLNSHTHNHISWFDKLISFFFIKSYSFSHIFVPRYTLRYYFRTMLIYYNAYKTEKNINNDVIKEYKKLLDSYTETSTRSEEKDILRYGIRSYERTIDSLIGELIIRGVSENEVSEMFDNVITYKDWEKIKYEED